MGLLLSNEADIGFFLFKYDSNFNFSLGSEFGERDGVLVIGPFRTTIISWVLGFCFVLFFLRKKRTFSHLRLTQGDVWRISLLYSVALAF